MDTKISNDVKQNLINDILKRCDDKIIEKSNADLLIKLIKNADDLNEAINISALGTTRKKTGFHFDKRLEKLGDTIKYFKKNEKLSFKSNDSVGAKQKKIVGANPKAVGANSPVDCLQLREPTTVKAKSNSIVGANLCESTNQITHKLIIGDNYDALQNLLIQYKGKIDVIYIDPPYGKDSMGEFAKTNYDNAITRDNLLSMLYNRLILARELMSDNGVIFCSIDDRNQAYVKCLFDEVFGEKNFINTMFVLDNLKGKTNDNYITSTGSKVIVYLKNKKNIQNNFFNESENIFGELVDNKYSNEDEYGLFNPITFKKTGQSKYREDRPYMFYPILEKNNTLYAITDEEYYKIYNKDLKKFDDKFIEKLKEKYKKYNFILPLSDDNKYLRWTSGFNTFKAKMNTDIYYENGIKQKTRPDIQEMLQIYASGTPKSFMYKPSYANGTEYLSSIIGSEVFKFPKPIDLIKDILHLHKNKEAIILDFFAGSGTTGQAVLELNKEDGGNRQFILCTNNEKTETTKNGIAIDVTTKRLKRVMTGKCYDGKNNFEWIKKNKPLGGNLDVYEIKEVFNKEKNKNKSAFSVIDETLYGVEKFKKVIDKIKWVCENFEKTQKYLEEK